MNAFLRLLRYAAPYRLRFAWAIAAMLVYAAASAALAYLIKDILDKAARHGAMDGLRRTMGVEDRPQRHRPSLQSLRS